MESWDREFFSRDLAGWACVVGIAMASSEAFGLEVYRRRVRLSVLVNDYVSAPPILRSYSCIVVACDHECYAYMTPKTGLLSRVKYLYFEP